jgi:hypothetical protein
MDTKDVLVAAKQAVEDADVSKELEETAYAKAVDLIAQKSVPVSGLTSSAAVRADQSPPPASASKPEVNVTSASMLDDIAARLKLDRGVVEEVFYERDGEVEVTVSPTKLESTMAAGTQQLALLVTAMRQADGSEEYTPVDEVRKVAKEFNKHDSDNFARTVGDMGKYFQFRGSPRKREIRLNKPGWEEASKLVARLAGGDN